MNTSLRATRQAVLSLAVLFAVTQSANAQLWQEFADGDSPHVVTQDIPMSIPDLIDGTTDQIVLPVLVILLEFSDVTHQPFHTPNFYNDMVFGTGSGEWTANHASVKQIFEANSNGRLILVPAVETYGTANDGIVGWITTQCPPGISGSVCVNGTADGQSCDPGDPSVCENGGGTCETCASWDYYRWKDWKKRAEAIRRSEPYVQYENYDIRDRFWSPGSDGIVRSNELAVVVIHARPNCMDFHDHADWGGEVCAVGTMRPTDPAEVPVDGVLAKQYPGAIPEATGADVFAHELAHEVYGLADLYSVGGDSCNPGLRTADGTVCSPCAMDEKACNDACPDAACVEDTSGLEGTYWSARGATVDSTGSNVSSCGTNDTKDVWFTYTPTASENVVVSTCSSGCSFDTTLAIFDGCNGNELGGACNDNSNCPGVPGDCGLLSKITVPMSAGTTYWIRVSGVYGTTGTFNLTVTGGKGTCNQPKNNRWYPQPSGPYSMMDDQSTYLSHLDPWSKIHLGFVKPLVVTQDGTYTIHDAETGRSFAQQDAQPEAIVIYNPRRPDPYKEYFILENRTVIESDGVTTLDSGLAVWLIHEDPFPGDSSMEPRRSVRLIRRGAWAANDEALFDGSEPGCYDLTPTSTPKNTNWTDGSASNIEIRDISAAGPTMTVTIRIPGLYVDVANTGSEDGSEQHPFDTLIEGLAAGDRRTIRVAEGTYSAGTSIISTPCTLMHWRGGSVWIGQ